MQRWSDHDPESGDAYGGDEEWRGPLIEDAPDFPLGVGVFLAIAVVGFALAGLLL